MKCTNCKEEPATAYYKTKPVCKNCFERLRWGATHCSLEDLKRISLMRTEKQRAAIKNNRIDNPQSQKVYYKCLPCTRGKGFEVK